MRSRLDVPMRRAVSAHDDGSNKGRGQLPEECRLDTWSRAFVEDPSDLRTVHGDFHGDGWPLARSDFERAP